jgi:hypothetical protein
MTTHRSFISRFCRSYMGWRAIYGRWESAKAAFVVAILEL